MLTSKPRGFSHCGLILADQVVVSAIVDRVIDNAVVVNIRGHSYRIRTTRTRHHPSPWPQAMAVPKEVIS